MLFILPELFMTISTPSDSKRLIWPLYAKSLIYISVFYINYYLILPKTLSEDSRPRILRFLGYNVLVLAAALIFVHLIIKFGWNARPPRKNHGMVQLSEWQVVLKFAGHYLREAVTIILTIALAFAIRLSDKWVTLERRKRAILTHQREVELSQLKSQLNPHFLFNTLNSVYSLIDIDKTAAQSAIHRLSGMLRYMLYESGHENTVKIDREAEFIYNYIELMRLRLPADSVVFIKEISYSTPRIPPMLFLCQVENCFKHAYPADSSHKINISLSTGANSIYLKTENHCRPNENPAGVGLSNLQRRLALIYGSEASLTSSLNHGIFVTELHINLKRQ